MKYNYEKCHKVNYTDCDKTICLSLSNSFDLVQDNATEFFGTFRSDNVTNKKENNAVWVVTKSVIKFNRFPLWRENIKLKSYTSLIKPIRINITTVATDEKENIIFIAKQEMCPIDVTERKIRKIDSINFPNDMDIGEELIKEPFSRLRYEFEENDLAYKRKVMATDIDFSNHCNNVKYINFVMDSLPSSFIEENKIDEFEIHYIKETVEGRELKIYKEEIDGKLEFLIKDGENEITRAGISFSKR